MRLMQIVGALALTGALLSGCGGVNSPSNNNTETFNGTVTSQTGATEPAITHLFSVGRTGEMSVRLTAIAPNQATLIGLTLGEQINGGCAAFNRNDFTGLNRDVFITPIQRGNFCIQVFNGGGVTVPTTYTLQVNHP